MNLKSVTIRLGIFSGVEPFDFFEIIDISSLFAPDVVAESTDT